MGCRKGKEGPQCAMMVNSQLDGTNPEWDSEETKSHLPFSVCHPKDIGTIQRGPQSHINTFQKSKASIYFLVSIGGPHMGVIKSLRIKQTGQCVRLLGGCTQLRCLNAKLMWLASSMGTV